MPALGTVLNPLIARPRPSPQLVQVIGSPPGYSFPSSFALTYASTLGFLAILAGLKSNPRRPALVLLCGLLLILGGLARIALGGHWSSDIIISYFVGLLWAAFLLVNFAAKT
jgi:membrane-associated phospholipid phosphatase